MQHHPGSWYIPWGVPLQKMLAVPAFNPATGGYQPQMAAAPQAPQPQPGPNQAQQSPYSHPHPHHPHHPLQTMHPNAAIPMHPAAAAAMFTPLTLRSFMAHPHLNLSQQPMQTATASQSQQPIASQTQSQLTALNLNNVGVVPVRQTTTSANTTGLILPMRKVSIQFLFCKSFCSFFRKKICSIFGGKLSDRIKYALHMYRQLTRLRISLISIKFHLWITEPIFWKVQRNMMMMKSHHKT